MKASNIALRCILAAALGTGVMASVNAAPVTDQKMDQLQTGMSEDQVQSILGKPGRAMTYALSGQTDWTYSNDHIDYDSSTVVVNFDPSGHLTHAYIIDTNAF